MKEIVLFCAGGMSTSLLVNKMKESAMKLNKDYNINAYGLGSEEAHAPNADCILLGPQVRYALKQLQDKYPNIPIDSIDMRTYGTMDGSGALKQAMKMMKE